MKSREEPERVDAGGSGAAAGDRRMVATLERMLEIPAADRNTALTQVADLIAQVLRADKVDAFLYDRARDSLAAISSSNQPLSALQHKHGLDVLPIANGGRVVWVFQTGHISSTGRLDQDEDEVRGIKETLRVRSQIGVPLELGGRRRGVIMIASQQADFFTPDDVRFAQSVTRWAGLIAHRAELVEEIARNSVAQGRRSAAEELITVFAHDMRNHISPVVIRLQMLERRAGSAEPGFFAQELGLALRTMERMRALVDDILDVARIDRGVLGLDSGPVDLAALVKEAAATLSTDEQRILVRSKLMEEMVIVADAARVRQCVENLLSNALKHSPAGAPVTVLLQTEAQEGRDHAVVEVIDEGPGVAPEMLPHIFERFTTGHAAEGGLGLGLYLAKRIAQAHGGDLTVTSVPGRGARFSLRLPV